MLARTAANYRQLSLAICALAVFLLALQTIDYINFSVDDVFIPLRIADNVVSGYGFVYNKGEYIEGHSDPLWVAILAACSTVVPSETPYTLLWIAKGLSYLFGLLSLVLTYHLLSKMLRGSPARTFYAALGMLALVICSPFILWACSGLEMTLVAFLYLLATNTVYDLLYTRTHGRARLFIVLSITFILVTLTRPEAPLFAAAAFGFLFFTLDDRRNLILYTIAPYVSICGLFLLWRYTTYGDLLPSAFYAKTSNGVRSYILGAKYFLGSFGGVCGPLIMTMPFVLLRKESLWKIRSFIVALLAATMAFTVYSSGDWMPAFRFLVLVAPLVVILGILSLRFIILKLISEWTFSCRALPLLASIALIATANIFVMRDLIRGSTGTLATGFTVIRGHTTVDHERVALWLQEHLHANETVATGEAGLIGYLNPTMRLLDLNGLMDRKIAYDRKAGRPFDAEYVLRSAPEYIILFGWNEIDPHSRSIPAWGDYTGSLVGDPRFMNRYERKATFVSFDVYQKRTDYSSIR